MDQLFKLSVSAQIALGSGYVAYCLAYMGIRRHHQAIDVTLSSLGFSLIGALVLAPSPFPLSLPQPWISVFAVFATLSAGLLWRWNGRALLGRAFRIWDVSWRDDSPSALDTINNDHRFFLTQIAVLLDDGTWLRCDDSSKFANAPFGPCVIGEDGGIAMYLTHQEDTGKEAVELKSVSSEEFGTRLTYIPPARIRQITFRHKRR